LDKPYSVAVVGLGGVFPSAPDVSTFWQNILACKDASVEVPAHRWVDDPSWFYGRKQADRVASLRVCLLEETPQPKSKLEEPLDDLSRMSLAAAEMALQDATSVLQDRSKVATILASIALPTAEASALSEEFFLGQLGASLEPPVEAPEPSCGPQDRQVTGRPAQVVAKGLNLGGFTLTLDAACASSLYAVKLACDALTEGRADAVLAGGANRADTLYTQEGFTALGACSSTGHCSPFDKTSDGLVVGEGAGFLLLKRVEDAVRDGDRVYAVIRGIGLSNDIGGSLLAPDSEGQLRALIQAYAQAGWSAEDVGLVECHGTGTPMGDRTEFHSLTSFWPKNLKKKTTVLGSVKSQIGHLLTGAGAAGLVKVIMAIHHRTLPPMINFKTPAKGIDLANSPFEILSKPKKWRHDGPLRGGVSAFGFGGINGHVLLEEPGDLSSEKSPAAQAVLQEVVVTAVGAKIGSQHDVERMMLDILSGQSAASVRPDSRWPGQDRLPGDLNDIRGAFLDQLDVAAGDMRIPPKDMGDVLLQQSLLLAAAGQATAKSSLGGKERCRRSGALVGLSLDMETTNYHLRWALSRMLRRLGVDPRSFTDEQKERLRTALSRPLDSTRTLGALGSIVASRAAREFSLGGPSYAISCGELSGVRALEIGTRAIANGEMDSCLVGAVDLFGDPRSVWAEDRAFPFTREGRSRPFSADADGTTLAEGAIVLVLKSRTAALADGDEILATIEGIHSAGGLHSLPRVLDSLSQQLKGSKGGIGYLDVVSRAMPQQDQELLREWEARFPAATRPTAVGTATANLGFAGSCSGLLAVARCVLACHHKVLPGLNDCPEPLEMSGQVYLPTEASFWWHDGQDGPRRAVAAGLASGGDAFCLQLREESHQAIRLSADIRAQALPAQLFLVPPDSLSELKSLAAEATDLPRLALLWSQSYSNEASKPVKGPRGALVARSLDELRRGLEFLSTRASLADGESLDGQAGVFYRSQPLEGKTAWVFPGSGNHYLGMGRELATLFPEVASEVCSEAACSYQHFTPWLTQPFDSDRRPGWEEKAMAAISEDPLAPIFSQVTFAILAARVMGRFLPQPDAAVGYSLGESAALFATGAWRDRDQMFHRTVGSPLFAQQLRGPYQVPKQVLGLSQDENFVWRVIVVNRDQDSVEKALRKLGRDDLFLLIVNTQAECVVGGGEESIDELVARLECDAFSLVGVPTVHCPLMHPVEESYRDLHRLVTTPPEGLSYYNGHRAERYIPDSESAAASITENALHGFSFPSLVDSAYSDGVRRFIEVGPGGSCARMIKTILEGRPHWTRSVSLPREGGEAMSLLKVLAGAYVQGVEVQLSALYGLAGASIEPRSRPRVQVKAGASLARPAFPAVPWSGPSSAVPEPGPVRPELQAPVPRSGPLARPSHQAPQHQISSRERTSPTRALVWTSPRKPQPSTLTKDGKAMTTFHQPESSDLQPVIGLHPQFAGDPSAQVAASIVESARQTAVAHESYLQLMERTRVQMENLLSGVMNLEAHQVVGTESHSTPQDVSQGGTWMKIDPTSSNPVMRGERPHRHNLAFDRDMCMEFAIGSVAKVLGEKFRQADSNSVRVRLPDEPLMLCDRILEVEGEPCSLGSGRLVTEHDVFPESWYLDHDRAPVCISVEAGQADLFLCSYLGIDLATDGTRAYRLLDATVSFHRGLPEPGETILYDIRINKFVRQGEVYLFFFEFDGTINGEPLITMRNGCAGFHTYEEIASSGGIVLSPMEKKSATGKSPAGWMPSAPFPHGLEVSESYSDDQVERFRDGDLAGCFGSGFEGLPLVKPYGLPKGRMKLFDRVVNLEPRGGRFGLGRIQAEADIHPDDWFLTCHFKDDMVMPGTLMYECCAHSLRFLLARLGWVAEEANVAFEPRLNTPAQLRCRGPVTVETKKVLYQVDIKEIGFGPEPYVVTDALMFGDGKPIVRFVDMSMKLTGVTEEDIRRVWSHTTPDAVPIPALYDKESIMQFSNGRPSLAFGSEYEVFDEKRRIARLPGPPYQFMDRVVEVDHPKFVLQKGGWIEAHYDVPPNEWYFGANRQTSMAYCILLEAALQPCGWLAAYAGSALRSESDVKFRNLGGTATLFKEVFPDTGTIRMRVRMTDVNEAGGMIIENFAMQVYAGDDLIYDGTTYFGFFSAQALAKQVGVRDAAERTYLPNEAEWANSVASPIPVVHPFSPEDPVVEAAPLANMPAKALLMMDRVDIFLPQSGGTKGLGFIQGSKIVDPDEWFFKAHFYQDPVWPGSLGLEAFLQLLRHAALAYWPELANTHRFEPIAVGLEHTWAYRGQVIPTNKKVVVDVSIVRREEGERPVLVGSGFLRVDGTPIYEMTNFGLRLVPN
jgi:acyl transferase domain-containing protein/3-hydroxymyristoyl/3-hydroxydecanoyl-(acyl carrier protein) dehydratase